MERGVYRPAQIAARKRLVVPAVPFQRRSATDLLRHADPHRDPLPAAALGRYRDDRRGVARTLSAHGARIDMALERPAAGPRCTARVRARAGFRLALRYRRRRLSVVV